MTALKKRILVIDDEVSVTRLLKLCLEETGAYEVRVENQGSRGVETAREFRPDVILLDVIMPDTNGADIALQIRADSALQGTRIVFLTAIPNHDAADGRGQGRVGGFPLIAKPATVTEVIECIEKQLESPPPGPRADGGGGRGAHLQ